MYIENNRPQLARLLKAVEPGDVVVVARLDRLARSSRDLLNIIHELNEAGAAFKSLADPWCDTTIFRTRPGRRGQ
jgi:DNA invertase Pin-like site-specific DNA recombinase